MFKIYMYCERNPLIINMKGLQSGMDLPVKVDTQSVECLLQEADIPLPRCSECLHTSPGMDGRVCITEVKLIRWQLQVKAIVLSRILLHDILCPYVNVQMCLGLELTSLGWI